MSKAVSWIWLLSVSCSGRSRMQDNIRAKMLFSPLLFQHNASLFLHGMNIFMQSSMQVLRHFFFFLPSECLYQVISCNAAVLFSVTFLSLWFWLCFFPSLGEIILLPADSLREHLILRIYLINNSTSIEEVEGD